MKTIKGKIEERSLFVKICLFLLLMVLTTLLALGVWMAIFNGDQSLVSLKVMQMLQTVGTFLLPCLAGAYLWSKRPMHWLQMDKGIGWKESVICIVLIVCASPGINLLAWLNGMIELPSFLSHLEELMKQQEESAALLTERFIRADNAGTLLLNVVLIALLPAISEEVCFRGTLQTLFSSGNRNRYVAVWASAVLFSAIHFQFYGFVPRMLLGALFGYMLLWSGSLWLPILAHFTNNCMSVLLYNFFYMQGKNVDEIDAFGTEGTVWAGIVSLLLSGVMIYLLRHSLTIKRASSRISAGN